jgi:hypothetical protein
VSSLQEDLLNDFPSSEPYPEEAVWGLPTEEELQRLCTQHKEKLKLFCPEDQQPVCLVCRDSRTHTGHKFCPIFEIVQDHKERVKVELELLKEKLGLFTEAKLTCHQTAKYIRQADFTQMQIRIEFDDLRKILLNEEEGGQDTYSKGGREGEDLDGK